MIYTSCRKCVVIFLVSALVGSALLSCAATVEREPIDDQKLIEQLEFFKPGGPTRAEVEQRLGPPVHVYESGRVVTYVLEERDGRLTAIVPVYASGTTYTLVIEYAADDKLVRRSLLPRRSFRRRL